VTLSLERFETDYPRIWTRLAAEKKIAERSKRVTLDEPGTYIFEAKNIGTITHALQIEGN
jgi:hypothetical protein